MQSKIGTTRRPLRVAIIGAGPSGFYAAGALLEQNNIQVSIDIFDRLPTPYGLVRDGVAPDHQRIKSVTRIYHKTAADPRVRFFGNVSFGTHITHDGLRRYYDQVVYAVGCPSDRKLGIPGEDLIGSDPATIFVGWYNGRPDHAHLDFDLTAENVAVVGNGNVAMDVTRILAKPAKALEGTDITDHALERLRESRVKRIHVLGRRGPAQAKFTNPELRELGEIEGVDIIVDPQDLELDPYSQKVVEEDKQIARNLRTLREFAEQGSTGRSRQIHLRFFVSPVEILGEHGHVTGVRLEHNELQPTESGYLQAVGTGCYETLPIELIFRAIGYKGVPLPGVPYEPRRGTIPNREGRVIDPETRHPVMGEYVVGWAKRGPTGVIGTNKADAVETVEHMLEDAHRIAPVDDARADPWTAEKWIREQQPQYVTFDDWLILNQIETERGKPFGRPRVKFCNVQAMLDAIARERQKTATREEDAWPG
ncbi:MAG: FAD-dependent oxidoreductase [Chloroflexota bacterium]|nr:FAD-dependent oxidoreductase [Chloroflexota bacterium]